MIAFRYVRYDLCYKNQISRDTAFEIQKHVNFLPCKKSPNMEVFLVCKISALGQKRIKNCINSETFPSIQKRRVRNRMCKTTSYLIFHLMNCLA